MRKPRATPKKAKTTRKPGRPPRDAPVVTRAMLEKMGDLWLEGLSEAKIGEGLGIDRTTVRHHLDATIRPNWDVIMRSRLAEDLAKVALIERTAWRRFHSAEVSETREHIEKALMEGGRKPRLVKQAISKVTRTGEMGWLQIVQWCLEFRARIHAHYAPTRHHIDVGGELRVAGMTPADVDDAMLKRLHEQIAERRKHQNRLDGLGDLN